MVGKPMSVITQHIRAVQVIVTQVFFGQAQGIEGGLFFLPLTLEYADQVLADYLGIRAWRTSDIVHVEFMKGLVDNGTTDKMYGGLCGKLTNVTQIILTGACQVGIDGGWA